MTRAVTILCLLGAAGVWAWALFAPKTATVAPLPQRFVGAFEVAGIETPPGMPNPLPPGKQYLFHFTADGTYVLQVFLNGGFEILRREGAIDVGGDGIVTLNRVSSNRREDRAPAERFHASWGQDDTGPFLALRHAEAGYTFRLRPVKA
ncbi:MAG TPA: hypothetical protein VFY93_09795 [Planctomycetota bacterium]|nr:hypothetical protein [Planctomycetota bacterium]